MSYNQGDIVLVPFPFSDQSGNKRRPALVISNNSVNKTQDILLVQITKNDRSDEFSVKLDHKDLTVPLQYVSEVRCHKILVTDKGLIVKKISAVTKSVLKTVSEKICDIVKV